jgi:short-subunit dehydrogenase
MTEAKRVIFITGASSGIGYETALAFVKNGDIVVGTARRADRLMALQEATSGLSGIFFPVVADVQSADDLVVAVRATVEQFGKIDVLIANAGVGHRGDLVGAEWDSLETLLRTNIDGVIHSIRASVPAMPKGGHIIIISSVAYNLVSPYTALYAASKAFVSSLSRSLRLELQDQQIAVTDMLVGRVATEFNEKRLGKGGRGGGFPSAMPADYVAERILKATKSRRKTITLRWIDRLLVFGNLILPDVIGRMALKQYR